MNKLLGLLLAALLFAALPLGDALGRGFGGFRGGGFGGGGFGGFRGGGFDADRFAGFRGGGVDAGVFRDRDFGALRDGYGARLRDEAYRPEAERRLSGDDWRAREGYDTGRIRDTAGVSRNQLDRFLGMPTEAGLDHVAAGGFAGGRVTAGRVEGPRDASAAFITAKGVRHIPPEWRSAQGFAVRNDFNRYNIFTPEWYRHHSRAWAVAALTASAWATATWASAADWVGCDSTPVDYDYGTTVLYQGSNVYVEGQPVGSSSQYYDQASSLAASTAATQDDQSQWLSLGVFGMVQGDQTDPTMIFQLAVNHEGIIRGNFLNTITNTNLPVHGAVDKKTQRAAWTAGDNKDTVFDTGLYNLTKDEAPTLVHLGKDSTQEWLMVRLKNKDEAEKDS
jgi:hypothetical protein